jgi:hypothetical protein
MRLRSERAMRRSRGSHSGVSVGPAPRRSAVTRAAPLPRGLPYASAKLRTLLLDFGTTRSTSKAETRECSTRSSGRHARNLRRLHWRFRGVHGRRNCHERDARNPEYMNPRERRAVDHSEHVGPRSVNPTSSRRNRVLALLQCRCSTRARASRESVRNRLEKPRS